MIPTAFVGFVLAVVYPSIAIFKKVGTGSLLLWLTFALGCAFVLARLVRQRQVLQLPSWIAMTGLGAMHLALLVGFLAIHPLIDNDGFRLAGRDFGSSDGDEALELALSRLQAGEYPYRAETFLGNPITPLPGALLLAAPFYFIGNVGLQNVFWLAVLFGGIAWWFRASAAACLLAAATFLLCPTLVYHVLQGTDYVANATYVLASSVLLLESMRRDAPAWLRILASSLLGVALSSRMNFLACAPLIFLALRELRGWRQATRAVLPCALAFVVATLPFYLYDPAGFSPLHTEGKLSMGGRMPWAPIVVPALGVLLAFALGSRTGGAGLQRWLGNAFIVQFYLVASGMLVASLANGELALSYAHFGLLALPFGVAAFGPAWLLATRDRAFTAVALPGGRAEMPTHSTSRGPGVLATVQSAAKADPGARPSGAAAHERGRGSSARSSSMSGGWAE